MFSFQILLELNISKQPTSMFVHVSETYIRNLRKKYIQIRFSVEDLSANVFGVLGESLAIAIDGCIEPLESAEINSAQDFGRCIRRNVGDMAWK